MSLVKSKLKALGSKLHLTKQPDQRDIIQNFFQDLRTVAGSIEELVEDLGEEFENQVIKERSRIEKTFAKLPSFLQPSKIKESEHERKKLSSVSSRVHHLSTSLDQIEEVMVEIPLTEEEVGKRIYEVAYPGQEISEENIDNIETRFQELESKFFDSLKVMQEQMHTVMSALTQISEKLSDQGVVLKQMDDKLDRVETKIDLARITLEKISKKLTQNKVILAFLLGAVIILVGALILL